MFKGPPKQLSAYKCCMRIALLNLPIDNNYGGNLQRYALMKVLQDMGHDVTHLNLRFHYYLPWYKMPYTYIKRVFLKYIFGRNIKICQESYSQLLYEKRCAVTEPFYQEYIKHTEPIMNYKQLKRFLGFDAYVVGSDQVWRKRIANKYLYSMFLDFLPRNSDSIRVAYGVSLGVTENELNKNDILKLSELYRCFDAVSVREDSALELFKQYGWTHPQAKQVLDPTFLLSKEDYINLIDNGNTRPSTGDLFCYILDSTEEKKTIISDKAKELHLTPFSYDLQSDNPISIEQWLRSFVDAGYVVTDSYHGLVFSIIFNKPFYLIRNEFRGNARFDSVLNSFSIIQDSLDWVSINEKLDNLRAKSLSYLSLNI